MSLSAALGALVLGGCATAPPRNVYLEDAHRAYDQASASAEVARFGQGELVRARDALARADQTWNDRRDDAETNHLAYLALQNTQLAMNMAAKRAADARIETAGAERERLRADIRTREAQLAQQNAVTAQAQAQTARAEAQSAQAQAQFAQTQAQTAQAAAAAEAERANRLQRELAELQAKPTDHGLVVMLQDVLFDVGRASLLPGAQTKLDQLAAALKNHPERRVLVEGYTDSTGSVAANMVLSRARAESVRNALLARGIGGDRIEARGNGEARPVATNATQAGRTQNRRVEVVFSDERGRFASAP
jgi:outer membrane protein OmpA-like peptidoglycan-associated protein